MEISGAMAIEDGKNNVVVSNDDVIVVEQW